MTQKVGIIGLGYVGLPLCIRFAEAGCEVLGFDIDQQKVNSINARESYIHHIDGSSLSKLVQEEKLSATGDFQRAAECNSILICVPTPLGKHRNPDLSYVLGTGRRIAPYFHPGTLIVLESTTYPGTTEEELRSVLEGGSGMLAGRDFHLAYSPEREDPGNPDSQVAKIPKVVGGLTDTCLAKAKELYEQAVDTVVPVSSCRTAEATKLLENIFRSVNIALVNELKVIYEEMDIDLWEVIEAAKTKPFGYMPFYPGPGLGGHCIPIDPFYLAWKAREVGKSTRFIELAGEVNASMPEYVFRKTWEALNSVGKAVANARVLVVGLAYKKNVDDDRESPSYAVMNLLANAGACVNYYDPFIPKIRAGRKTNLWAGMESIEWTAKEISQFDVAIVVTAHDEFKELAPWPALVVDTRRLLPPTPGVFQA
ncbi:MAG: nucleotide sugar dehydrogenase [Aureliella sp.]